MTMFIVIQALAYIVGFESSINLLYAILMHLKNVDFAYIHSHLQTVVNYVRNINFNLTYPNHNR